ncbi:hypothetical protein SLEP1_g2696 [Rubroshorea leprosula]|uniref:Bifunctional inhibitor/plant lipid transfer protein/seed storage helical domain-containing protein n=1 Tax=Rubroshorea leprosula TaxID=152421 RepID=A0AAV5HIE3_9ROSI|nr:hypothetical protein SLEP1_g2696 [Rubroshorea leprosula]
MASTRCSRSVALFILFNILFFICVTSVKVVPYPPKEAPSPPAVPESGKCPTDTLKFGVCGSWLGLVYEVVGTKPSKECCTLISGLAELEAALCLCTAIKANALGVIKVKVPIAISLLLNGCGKKIPKGFVCA